MEKIKVTSEELNSKMRSKKDIYNILKYQLHFYLPSLKRCPVRYVKDIMNGNKKAFKTDEVAYTEVPEFPELSVKSLWETWRDNPSINEYMPDYKETELPERSFMLGIVGTLYKDELDEIVEAAYKYRSKHYKDDADELIELTSDMKELIDQIASYNTTPGKGLNLLKMKAGGKRRHKAPIKFPVDLQAFGARPIYKAKRMMRMTGDAMMRTEHLSEDEEEEEKRPPSLQSPFKRRTQEYY